MNRPSRLALALAPGVAILVFVTVGTRMFLWPVVSLFGWLPATWAMFFFGRFAWDRGTDGDVDMLAYAAIGACIVGGLGLAYRAIVAMLAASSNLSLLLAFYIGPLGFAVTGVAGLLHGVLKKPSSRASRREEP